eukprot:GHVL01030889.1.p1 GENE.GHVL01030889.1~~GHVL01030889.1.p1  ORF type:complete len:621 (-),score=165.10 GHVL01030889.1:1616-3370(-)
MAMAADIFNQNPGKSLEALQQLGQVSSTPESMASFLKETPGLDMSLLGQYLAKRKEFNSQVREAFVGLFDLSGVPLVGALRMLLNSFRLPGEAQEIERLMESFSKGYFLVQTPVEPIPEEATLEERLQIPRWIRRDNYVTDDDDVTDDNVTDDETDETDMLIIVENMDAVFIFSYSIIMLNTDLHSAKVKNKMTLEEFCRNNRGINNNKNFEDSFLKDVFFSIKNEPIELFEIVAGKEADHWDDLMRKCQDSTLKPLSRAGAHEHHMFALMLDANVINTLIKTCETSIDENVVGEAVGGLLDIAKIASYYWRSEPVNLVLTGLCSLVVYSMPVKSQIALQGVLKIMQMSLSLIRESWTSLVEFLLTLHSLSLLPEKMTELDDFTDSHGRPLYRLCRIHPPIPKPSVRGTPGGGDDVRPVGFFDSIVNALFFQIESDDEDETPGVSVNRRLTNLYLLDESETSDIGTEKKSENVKNPVEELRGILILGKIDELFLERVRYLPTEGVTILFRSLLANVRSPSSDLSPKMSPTPPGGRNVMSPTPPGGLISSPPPGVLISSYNLLNIDMFEIRKFRKRSDSILCLEL